LSETEAGLLADQQFLADMTKSCATKTDEWNEAVKLRAEELAAIAETIKVLNDDEALDLFKKTLPSAGSSSFVQMSSRETLRLHARKTLEEFRNSGSPQLDLIMLALRAKSGGFEKVIALIDGMVATLKKEQTDDDDKKEYCTIQFDNADDKKKALERAIADGEASIAAATESIGTLSEEIPALEKGIKALDKEVAEATEQRKEESTEYNELMASDSTAKELLLFAKNRLDKFYNPKLYKAPPKRVLSDEDEISMSFGGTMAPTAPPGGIAGTGIGFVEISAHMHGIAPPPPPPEAFEAYAKKGEEATGVTTMIAMLVKDLDEEMTAAKTEEEESQKEYETMMKDSAMKRVQDLKTLAEKSATKADLESDVQAAKDTKLANTKQLMATMEYTQSLHAECDWLLQYFDVRKTARAGEVDALKNAKAVLSGADYSFLQARTAGFLAKA
jgi:hypothetical protein